MADSTQMMSKLYLRPVGRSMTSLSRWYQTTALRAA